MYGRIFLSLIISYMLCLLYFADFYENGVLILHGPPDVGTESTTTPNYGNYWNFDVTPNTLFMPPGHLSVGGIVSIYTFIIYVMCTLLHC